MPVAQLTDRAAVGIAGPDAATLMQNVVTLDVPAVDRRGSGYGALLTPQGKILWDFILHKTSDGYVADLRADQAEAFAKRLSLYRLRSNVKVAVEPKLRVYVEWNHALSLANKDQGGATRFLPGASGGGGPPKAVEGAATSAAAGSRPLHHAAHGPPLPSQTAGEEPVATQRSETGRRADPRVAALGGRWLTAEPVRSDATAAEWHRRRIALAVPEGGVDFVFGDTFPHDAAMDSFGGVAFDKGCYIGQEVVSRMRHRGTARRRIVALAAEGPWPDVGAEILAGGQPAGRLGSSADGRAIGLVRLDRVRTALERGEAVQVDGRQVAVSLPAWATYDWPAAAPAAAED